MTERESARLTRQLSQKQPIHLRVYNGVANVIDNLYWACVIDEPKRVESRRANGNSESSRRDVSYRL